MVKNKDYKFSVSLSKDAYINKEISGAMIGSSKIIKNREIRKKYGFKANKGIGYVETTTTSEGLYNSLLLGKVFCHLFTPESIRKDGTFGSSEKKDVNFKGSYVIGVDIDHTKYESAEAFVDKLSMKPTFWYTSYSNMQVENGVSKGARFRLIYVFDSMIRNKYFFRYIATKLNNIIEKDTDELIEDDCNLRCSQYFNGTNKDNDNIILSSDITYNIYGFNDFEISMTDYYNYLKNYCNYKNKTKLIKDDINAILSVINDATYERINDINNDVESINTNWNNDIDTMLNDYDRLDVDEFIKLCKVWNELLLTTKYIYRVEKDEWINGLYQVVSDDYFSLFYHVNTVKDGSKRRKTLYERMCLRRIIKEDITPTEMIFCTIIDIIRYFDNNDGLLNSDFIKRNVEDCFNLSIDDIKSNYANTLTYLRDNTKPKRGIIYINKKAHSKETTFLILDEYYNDKLTVKENLFVLNNILNYKIGKSTLYEYIKDRNLKSDSKKLTDNEILNLIDWNLSAIENYKILKDSDIKIGNKRLNKLYKENKNKFTANKNDNNNQNFEKSQTVAVNTDNQIKIFRINALTNFNLKASIKTNYDYTLDKYIKCI